MVGTVVSTVADVVRTVVSAVADVVRTVVSAVADMVGGVTVRDAMVDPVVLLTYMPRRII